MGYKIKRILVGTQQVRPYRYNPWANTIAYYPFDTNFNDYMGNYNLTAKAGSPSITTLNWVKCCYFNGSSDIWNDSLHMSTIWTTFTVCAWVYVLWDEMAVMNNIYWAWSSYSVNWVWLFFYTNWLWWRWQSWYNSTMTLVENQISYSKNRWYFVCTTYTNWTYKMYVNWVQTVTQSATPWFSSSSLFRIWWSNFNDNRWERYFSNWYVSREIIENKVWTADEIDLYYRTTKSNYWL